MVFGSICVQRKGKCGSAVRVVPPELGVGIGDRLRAEEVEVLRGDALPLAVAEVEGLPFLGRAVEEDALDAAVRKVGVTESQPLAKDQLTDVTAEEGVLLDGFERVGEDEGLKGGAVFKGALFQDALSLGKRDVDEVVAAAEATLADVIHHRAVRCGREEGDGQL